MSALPHISHKEAHKIQPTFLSFSKATVPNGSGKWLNNLKTTQTQEQFSPTPNHTRPPSPKEAGLGLEDKH